MFKRSQFLVKFSSNLAKEGGNTKPITPPPPQLVATLTRQPKQRKKHDCYVKQITKLFNVNPLQ